MSEYACPGIRLYISSHDGMTLDHVEEASRRRRPNNAEQRPLYLGDSENGTQAATFIGPHTRLPTQRLLDGDWGDIRVEMGRKECQGIASSSLDGVDCPQDQGHDDMVCHQVTWLPCPSLLLLGKAAISSLPQSCRD